MVEEKKEEGAGDIITILLEEALDKQGNMMMDKFSRSFDGYPPMTHLPSKTIM